MKPAGISLFAALLVSGALAAASARAQDYPTRAITLMVPFAAGGGIDASARLQAQRLSEILGVPIVVENNGAAAGMAGSARVAHAAPDGYTMLIGNSGTHVYSQALYKKPLYDSAADFTPIGLVTESPRILLARKDLPVANLQEFIAYAKQNQSKMQYGSAGVGSGTHLPCALLTMTMGVEITHIPYRGAGLVMQDLIAGRIDYMCDTIQTGAAQAKAGTVKPIAVMAPKRVSIIPDLATSGEQGLPASRRPYGTASSCPRERPIRSCGGSTRRRRRCSRIRRCANGSRTSGSISFRPISARRTISQNSCPRTSPAGAR
jgi:tripartite-type tricarboxylate transporter receptor subunit TctC